MLNPYCWIFHLRQEGTPSVDIVHEVISLHVSVSRPSERDSWGVVYQNINTIELKKKSYYINVYINFIGLLVYLLWCLDF